MRRARSKHSTVAVLLCATVMTAAVPNAANGQTPTARGALVGSMIDPTAARDPTCYADLDALFDGGQARSAFYVTVGTTAVGVGVTLWGAKTKSPGKIVGGLLLAAASAAGAVYFQRQDARYRNAETCGLPIRTAARRQVPMK